jgi:tetratricopeptide (TPR) repeat protein
MIVAMLSKLAVALLPIIGLVAADSIASALAAGRYPDALRMAAELLKTNPGDPRVWTVHGMALAGLGNTKASIASFDSALRLQPAFVPALKAASETAYKARLASAISYLERLLAVDPSSQPAHAMAAVLAFESGDCKRAIVHFEQSREEVSRNEQAASQFGSCLLAANRTREAVELFERILAASPSSAMARYNLAVAQIRGGQIASALATLGSHADSLDSESLNLLAAAQAADGRTALAVATLSRAAAKFPADERNYLDLAGLCQRDGELGKAIEVLDTGLRFQAASGRLHAARGVIYAQLGETAKAAADFEKAALLAPDEAYSAAGLSVLFTETGWAGDAVNLLRRKLKRSPNDANLNTLLADALMRDGVQPGQPGFAEARQALLRAIGSRPGFARAHAALGKLYLREGQAAKAVQELNKALEAEPGNRTALSQLSAALRSLGRTREAADAADRLRREYENDIERDAVRQRIRISETEPVTPSRQP